MPRLATYVRTVQAGQIIAIEHIDGRSAMVLTLESGGDQSRVEVHNRVPGYPPAVGDWYVLHGADAAEASIVSKRAFAEYARQEG